jgi:hypothetical protein
MPFDFRTYLRELTGIKEWEIEDLVGGAANFTVHAHPLSSASSWNIDGAVKLDLDSGSSVVIKQLKQAPDYYLAKSPGFTFSPYRQVSTLFVVVFHYSISLTIWSMQVIEAQALQWFLIPGYGLHTALAQNPCIWVPQMLLHDQSSSVLIQSDLGVVPDLYSILTDATRFCKPWTGHWPISRRHALLYTSNTFRYRRLL